MLFLLILIIFYYNLIFLLSYKIKMNNNNILKTQDLNVNDSLNELKLLMKEDK